MKTRVGHHHQNLAFWKCETDLGKEPHSLYYELTNIVGEFHAVSLHGFCLFRVEYNVPGTE
jgi:hypothetical protein